MRKHLVKIPFLMAESLGAIVSLSVVHETKSHFVAVLGAIVATGAVVAFVYILLDEV